jgi:hypothetical protein
MVGAVVAAMPLVAGVVSATLVPPAAVASAESLAAVVPAALEKATVVRLVAGVVSATRAPPAAVASWVAWVARVAPAATLRERQVALPVGAWTDLPDAEVRIARCATSSRA